MAPTTRSHTRSTATSNLLGLPNELLISVCYQLPHADHLVLLSMACKWLATRIAGSRLLWQRIDFSLAASKRISDRQLAALLERVHAKECTTYICLQYSKISGVGLLPIRGSRCLQLLDLRQSHGPSAWYPANKAYWNGNALVKVLMSLDGGEHGKHVLLPVIMQPDSVGHPYTELVDRRNEHGRKIDIMDLQESLKLMGVQACCECESASEVQECSNCFERFCNECLPMFECHSCSFVACMSCVKDFAPDEICANKRCPRWLCDVCSYCSLNTCVRCKCKFCDSCGRWDDESPEGEPYCAPCEDEYWEEMDLN